MIRNIVEIDESKCNGCGKCAAACHEGAIKMINGKAKLISDDYCDGLGDCLPACPADAIKIIKREARDYSEEMVQKKKEMNMEQGASVCGCPGSREIIMESRMNKTQSSPKIDSELTTWPVQLKLINSSASFLRGSDLLITADCAAYAYGAFHNDFMEGKVVIIACPKLDVLDVEKITDIIKNQQLKSVTAVRMEVPCCGGIEHTVMKIVEETGTHVPFRCVTLSIDGKIISDYNTK